jgi:hypothetical protein
MNIGLPGNVGFDAFTQTIQHMTCVAQAGRDSQSYVALQ